MLYVGSTKKKRPFIFQHLYPPKNPCKNPSFVIFVDPYWLEAFNFTPGSLWCNIFTLLYTLKSNYGAPPLPQACWWDRCLGNELEIGLLSCCFFFGGGHGAKLATIWICNYEKTLSKNAFASARRSVRLKKGWVELCCCTYVMLPFVHSTILFEDRYRIGGVFH